METIRIGFIGNSHVGKSNLIKRLFDGTFENSLQPTIGLEMKTKEITINKKLIKLILMDISGHEHFYKLVSKQITSMDIIILIYDVTNHKSFDDIEFWIDKIKLLNTKQNFILIGNKIDKDDRVISYIKGEELAKNNNCLFCETSSRNNTNISTLFDTIINL